MIRVTIDVDTSREQMEAAQWVIYALLEEPGADMRVRRIEIADVDE